MSLKGYIFCNDNIKDIYVQLTPVCDNVSACGLEILSRSVCRILLHYAISSIDSGKGSGLGLGIGDLTFTYS